jgi:cell division GTPase FtsZ
MPAAQKLLIDTEPPEFSTDTETFFRVDRSLTENTLDREQLAKALADAIAPIVPNLDLVVLVGGLGGFVGTAVLPQLASLLASRNILLIVLATLPMAYEGRFRGIEAMSCLHTLTEVADMVLVLDNQTVLHDLPEDQSLSQAYTAANSHICSVVTALWSAITVPGLVNCDLDDLRVIASGVGQAYWGFGTASGPDRAGRAARAALENRWATPEGTSDADGLLVVVTGPESLTLLEMNEAITLIQAASHPDANIVFSAVISSQLESSQNIEVAVLATYSTRFSSPPVRPLLQGDDRSLRVLIDMDTFDAGDATRFLQVLSGAYNHLTGDRLSIVSTEILPPGSTRRVIG